MADKQGFLTKEGGNIKSWKKRWMVLKGGAVYYSKSQSSSELGIIPLHAVSDVCISQKKKNKKHCFEVVTPERTFYLCGSSDSDRDSWMECVKAAVVRQQELKKRQLLAEGASSPDGAGGSSSGSSRAGSSSTGEVAETICVDDFDLLNVVGKGSFGKVLQVKKKDTGRIYAMKVLNKKTILERNELEHTRAEKSILQKLVHPFLVNLNYSFQTDDALYFVMDYINGGELFFHLQREEKFNENRVRFYCAEIVLGLEYLHTCGVLYRDLKPENILLTDDGHICMTDFGISKEGLVADDAKTSTFCGTPEYLAPEILQGKSYGKAVDWWSFGTLMFEMLTGLPPFYSQEVQEMYTKIMNEKLVFPPQVSADARSLLTLLLERNPEKRICNPQAIRQHPFFKSIDWDRLLRKEIEPPFVPSVKGKSDVSQVDQEFLSETPKLTPADGSSKLSATLQQHFDGFSYINTSEHLMK
eukprot:TRINITY_DN958_c0_g1_i1.p1 TRINITY_DN958_c0_g1~~TRINITY_DN958_c0_g1_i1.p1  ORF type:complete len:471 (-),score=106.88 TRINITY_DN958_c0_g1_i1:139-1551(-)